MLHGSNAHERKVAMKRSSERILTTHTGSLPRSPEVLELIFARGEGNPIDDAEWDRLVRDEVAATVRRQVDAGIDIVSDGEVGKNGYSIYVQDRLTGFDGEGSFPVTPDMIEFPDYAERLGGEFGEAFQRVRTPACTGPISVKDPDASRRDIENLKAATEGVDAEEVFMTAASPGVIAFFLENQHYATHEDYLGAIADAMRTEYEAIAEAGFTLQLDCPDLAFAPSRFASFGDMGAQEIKRAVELNVEALNHATSGIDPDRMRLHVCWGNYPGPHIFDVPLSELIDVVLRARPNGISFEACNPRHAHEWRVFEDVELPEEKVLIPGVIDSTTNYVEHPELVAQRLERYGRLVGMERVIAGTDCGFETFAGFTSVAPTVVWRKLASMAEGARLATRELTVHR
jgi:5-methyltetrahydropteroyltriglutamate--homocysteine methyltransferase